MAYDPDADLFYVGTGNAEPWAQQLRTSDTEGQPLRLFDPRGVGRDGRVEVALPGGAGRYLGLRQRPAADPGRPHDQRPAAQGHHAGQQERVLLRDRSAHGRVHFGRAVLEGHLGQGHRSEDRTADRQPGGVLRHRGDRDFAGRRRRAQLVADVVQSDDGAGVHSHVDGEQLDLSGRGGVQPETRTA